MAAFVYAEAVGVVAEGWLVNALSMSRTTSCISLSSK